MLILKAENFLTDFESSLVHIYQGIQVAVLRGNVSTMKETMRLIDPSFRERTTELPCRRYFFLLERHSRMKEACYFLNY